MDLLIGQDIMKCQSYELHLVRDCYCTAICKNRFAPPPPSLIYCAKGKGYKIKISSFFFLCHRKVSLFEEKETFRRTFQYLCNWL